VVSGRIFVRTDLSKDFAEGLSTNLSERFAAGPHLGEVVERRGERLVEHEAVVQQQRVHRGQPLPRRALCHAPRSAAARDEEKEEESERE